MQQVDPDQPFPPHLLQAPAQVLMVVVAAGGGATVCVHNEGLIAIANGILPSVLCQCHHAQRTAQYGNF
jgi:hypothetical protein